MWDFTSVLKGKKHRSGLGERTIDRGGDGGRLERRPEEERRRLISWTP